MVKITVKHFSCPFIVRKALKTGLSSTNTEMSIGPESIGLESDSRLIEKVTFLFRTDLKIFLLYFLAIFSAQIYTIISYVYGYLLPYILSIHFMFPVYLLLGPPKCIVSNTCAQFAS